MNYFSPDPVYFAGIHRFDSGYSSQRYSHRFMEDRLHGSLLKIPLLLLTFFSLPATILFAQPGIEWDKKYGGNMAEKFVTMTATPDGGYILAGNSNSGMSGEKSEPKRGPVAQTPFTETDYWIVKIAADGSKQWDKTIGGNGQDQLSAIISTSDGGYLVGGTSRSNASGEKSQDAWNPQASDLNKKNDYWIIKLAANGSKQWDKTIGGTVTDDLKSIAQTADGGYILAGNSNSSNSGDKSQRPKGSTDYWVVKITSDGTKQWDKAIGGSGEEDLTAVKQTSDGGYILAGSSNSPVSSDKTEAGRGHYDYWLVKISENGTKQWDKTYGGNTSDVCSSFITTADGGYLLGGTSFSTKSGEKSENYKGINDYWVVKVSSDGALQWDKTIGGYGVEYLKSVGSVNDGGYILAGYSESGAGADKTSPNKGLSDYWLVKISADGTKIWDKTLGTHSNDFLGCALQTADGGFLLAGDVDTGLAIGDKTQGNKDTFSGYTDFWLVKLTPEGSDKKLILSSPALTFETTRGSPLAPPQTVNLTGNTGTPNVTLTVREESNWLVGPASGTGMLQFSLSETGIVWDGSSETIVVATAPGYERAILKVTLHARAAAAQFRLGNVGDISVMVDEKIRWQFEGDADPGQSVAYSLINAPAGAMVNTSTGLFEWTPNLAGVYTYTVKGVTSGPPVLSDEKEMTVTVTERTSNETVRINAAGPLINTSDGHSFMADAYFGGQDRVSAVPQGDIANTTDDDLYRTGRCSPSFNYSIPVRNGNFQVILHFAETWFGAPGRGPGGVGKRRFHVNIEDQRKLTNYDIFARAGGAMRAVKETFPVTVTDNVMNIGFLSGAADMPRIAAIEIIMVERLARMELPLIADAYVNDGTFADTNFGSDPTLVVKTGTGNSILRNSYLKFGLGDNSDFTVAKLSIFGSNVEYSKSDFVALSAFGLSNDSWTENGITWNNAPAPAGPPIASTNILSEYDSNRYYIFDVTDFVRTERAGDKIATFMLKDSKSSNQKLSFQSKEGNYQPLLVIYTHSPYTPTARLSQDISIPSTEFEIEKSSIYPNPAQKSFTLQISDKHDLHLSAELVDVSGKRMRLNIPKDIRPGSKTEVDLAPLSVRPGIYLINLRSTVFMETHKLMITQ
jgi:hypothetical protein